VPGITIPPYLKKGDIIGITCPAGYMEAAKVQECVRVLTEVWGYRVRIGKTVGNPHHYFAGTDEERREDLQAMLDDPEVKAILCGRGGYGTGRIIDELNFRTFRKHPKWVIGFSDVTVLHSHILARYGIATLHAPMANAFNNKGYRNKYVQSLRDAIAGKKALYSVKPHRYNQLGKAKGVLTGGNLSLVAHLTGTSSEVDMRGKILFLEDIGEYLYNIDRMMYQLKRSGVLKDLAGLVLGGFTDNKDTERPFGKTVDQILHDIVKDYGMPVCFGFPVSHNKENYALKCGGLYTLDVRADGVSLREG
jgi:muramoyltetrapeptide carboxypeptidase